MPKSQMLLILGAVVLAAILVIVLLKPPSPANITRLLENPLAGRWQAQLPDAGGHKADCILDVPKGSVIATMSDGCPAPFGGVSGQLAAQKGAGIYAPDQYRPGDTGSFTFSGGVSGTFSAAYRFGLFGDLTTRDNRFGEVKWKKIPADKPLPKATDGILPAAAKWPLSDIPGVMTRATTFIRGKWQADAVLMTLNTNPDPSGGVNITLTYYSPIARQVRTLSPNASQGDLGAPTPENRDSRQSIPGQVLDLPAAINRAGLQGVALTGATLEWTNGGCGAGVFALDNAILPKCPPGNFEGIQWELETGSGRRLVPAT